MKIKTIIITLGLITTMISGGIVNYINSSKGAENTNTVMVEENVVNEESVIDKVAQADVIQTDMSNSEDREIEETKQEEKIEIQEESPKTTSTQTTKTNTNKGKTTTQETTTKQENNKNVVIETPKKEEPQPQPKQPKKELTESDLEYWCVGGGTHHIAGNGANEHGYYSSWNEANQAFENYTKGWNSVQYKIDNCSCGLYYFWAIQ